MAAFAQTVGRMNPFMEALQRPERLMGNFFSDELKRVGKNTAHGSCKNCDKWISASRKSKKDKRDCNTERCVQRKIERITQKGAINFYPPGTLLGMDAVRADRIIVVGDGINNKMACKSGSKSHHRM